MELQKGLHCKNLSCEISILELHHASQNIFFLLISFEPSEKHLCIVSFVLSKQSKKHQEWIFFAIKYCFFHTYNKFSVQYRSFCEVLSETQHSSYFHCKITILFCCFDDGVQKDMYTISSDCIK